MGTVTEEANSIYVNSIGTLVEAARQEGYATGVQEAQRAAYELGKDAVLKKLTAVLS